MEQLIDQFQDDRLVIGSATKFIIFTKFIDAVFTVLL